jgi:hypothetical protein
MLSESAERKLADQRMKEWSKDQEEYTEKQYQEIQKRKESTGASPMEIPPSGSPRTAVQKEEARRQRGIDTAYLLYCKKETAKTVHEMDKIEDRLRNEFDEDIAEAGRIRWAEEYRENQAREQREFEERGRQSKELAKLDSIRIAEWGRASDAYKAKSNEEIEECRREVEELREREIRPKADEARRRWPPTWGRLRMTQEEKEFLEPLDDMYKEISRLNIRADRIEADQEKAHEWSTEELQRRISQGCG